MHTNCAWIDDVFKLTVSIDNVESLLQNAQSPVVYWEKSQRYFGLHIKQTLHQDTVELKLDEALPMGEALELQWGALIIPVYPGAVVRTEWFDQHYAAPDQALGATYLPDGTTFSVWAPTATQVAVRTGGHQYQLERSNRGVWQTRLSGDWHGCSYDYEATIADKTVQVNDPYAKALLANSEKGVIVDLAKTDPSGFQRHHRSSINILQDAIIYELHVRDATMFQDSGTANKGKYLGLTQKNTKTKRGYSTGLTYMKELGITHVQLMPVNDFARVNEQDPKNDYNWGYDPLYFQVPEGSYATRADQPEVRITELKNMIQSFHEEDISVILDVVYNHVYIMEASPFEKLVPGYFFRYHDTGQVSDGTGVGNDFASERQMARKFILDSIDFWLNEYKVDGFRFDLMGALDVQTMNQIQRRCLKESHSIMLLGEGWDLPTALNPSDKATSVNSHKLPGIRFFNDVFRDTLKGGLSGAEGGYVNGNGRFIERLPSLVSGSAPGSFGEPFVHDVNQTVNYVACHDNYTLWDHLTRTNADDSEQTRKKMHQIATGITLLSQGVPFLHAGQEWFRTKQGDGNSYLSGDRINQLDWHARENEIDTIQFVKTLIAIRKQYSVFRLNSKQAIEERLHILETPHPIFGYVLLGDKEQFVIYVNPDNQQHDLILPSPGRWLLRATNNIAKEGMRIDGDYISIDPYEIVVWMKKQYLG